MTFQAGRSFVHHLHPAVKLAWLLWGTIAVFVFHSAVLPLAAAAGALGVLWLSGVTPWRIPGLRVWATLGLAILVAQVVIVREGDPLVGPVTDAGLVAGLRAMGRLMAVILMSALFVVTTEPFSLACGLIRIGLPYRWGFALVTALRLAPVFRLEANHICPVSYTHLRAHET